jgi:uncharacterized membrane protein YfcA
MSLDSIWIFLVPIVVIAGVVRGYAGFGFAAVAVVCMNFLLDPQQSIPVIVGLDLLCSAPLLRQAVAQADRPTFKLLTIGSILGIPVGLALLLVLPSTTLKLGICVLILVFTLLLAFDVRFRGTETARTKLGFGIFAGAGTSGSSVGGPIIVCYMLSSQLSSSAQRATMIMFFVVSELVALAALTAGGLINVEVVKMTLILLIPTLIGVRVGQALFNRKPPASLKQFALPLMFMIAVLGISATAGS